MNAPIMPTLAEVNAGRARHGLPPLDALPPVMRVGMVIWYTDTGEVAHDGR